MPRLTILLLLVLVSSSLAVITVRHKNRLAFVELQDIQEQRNRLQNEWGRLILEKATWAEQHNIADQAGERFGMQPPAPDEIITVQLGRDEQ